MANKIVSPKAGEFWTIFWEDIKSPKGYSARPVYIYDVKGSEVLCVYVTSKPPRDFTKVGKDGKTYQVYPGEIQIKDYYKYGFTKPSVVRCSRLESKPFSVLGNKISEASTQMRKLLDSNIEGSVKELVDRGVYDKGYLTMLKEDLNLDEEIKVNDTLNPDLWDNDNEMKEDVKDKLLDIVDNFLDNLKEDKINIEVVDVRVVGSSANYNYTDKSDIDLHIIADIDSLPCEQHVLSQLYNAYKSIFNSKYDIKIKGHDVEIYVEDVNQPAKSNGIYSLYTGWIKKPKREEVPEIDYEEFNKEFEDLEDDYFDLMDDLEAQGIGALEFPLDESLKENIDKLIDFDYDDELPSSYVITSNDDMLNFIRNHLSWEQFKIVYDKDKKIYMVGDPFDRVHYDLLIDAIKNGYYEQFNGKESSKTLIDYLDNNCLCLYINFDADPVEDYTERAKYDLDGTPMYVYAYTKEEVEDTPFLKGLDNNTVDKNEKHYSDLNEVYPNKGEKKKDFISRFMSATKNEYPDEKQRYAVANSYWNRRNKKKVNEMLYDLTKEQQAKAKTIKLTKVERKDYPYEFEGHKIEHDEVNFGGPLQWYCDDLFPNESFDSLTELKWAIYKLNNKDESLNENLELSNEYDSEGNQLTKDQVEFFKNSKVRDNRGRLLVCYHGTEAEKFNIFDHSFIGDDNKSGYGFYFTLGTKLKFKHTSEYACYINLTNPLTDMIIIDCYVRDGEDLRSEGFSQKEIIDKLSKKYKCDGIINPDRGVIAFYSNQIKSIDNKQPSNSNNINESYLNSNRDIFVTESAYEVKNKIINTKTPLRILYDYNENIYLICDENKYTHTDMIECAMKDGYFQVDEYGNAISNAEEYLDCGAWETWRFIPNGCDVELGEDGYHYRINYDFGSLMSRADDFGDYELYSILGEPISSEGYNESLNEAKAITWGDLDYGKKTDTRRMMGGRGTGHFGTGFYFVGAEGPYGLEGSRYFDYAPNRPIYEIDLDAYNLFKPKDNGTAYKIHDNMKVINDCYREGRLDSTPKGETKDLLGLLRIIDEEAYEQSYERDDLSDEEAEKEFQRLYREMAYNFVKENDLDPYIYYETEHFINGSKAGKIEQELQQAIERKQDTLEDLNRAVNNLSKLLNVDKNKLVDIIKNAKDGEDTISTQIFKALGYEGVDNTHLNKDADGFSGLDNFSYGTVIYDLKPGTYKKIKEPRGESPYGFKEG